jgi:hypothetical protein
MSDLVSQNLNMIFKTPKGETVHALKDVSFTLKKGRTTYSSWSHLVVEKQLYLILLQVF